MRQDILWKVAYPEEMAMECKLVSAIITTHNRAPDIVLRAVKSVLEQTYANIEIIVVDDSVIDYPQRDDVEREIRRISEKIHFVRHDECKGGCAARNTGLENANGFYIAFLDDDDEWLPGKIEEQIKGFTDNEIALVYCGCRDINEITNQITIRNTTFKKGFVFDELLRKNFIGGSSNPLIRKDCIDNVGRFDTEMQSTQDFDMWLRITRRYPVNYVDKALLNCYIHEGDRISTNVDRKVAGLERIIEKYGDSIDKDKLSWYMRHIALVPLYARKGWKKKAFSLWAECVKTYPQAVGGNIRQLLILSIGYNRCQMAYRKLSLLLSRRKCH